MFSDINNEHIWTALKPVEDCTLAHGSRWTVTNKKTFNTCNYKIPYKYQLWLWMKRIINQSINVKFTMCFNILVVIKTAAIPVDAGS